MINVKKKERKKKRVDRRDIFARSFSFLWAETTREEDFFFFLDKNKNRGKNDSLRRSAFIHQKTT